MQDYHFDASVKKDKMLEIKVTKLKEISEKLPQVNFGDGDCQEIEQGKYNCSFQVTGRTDRSGRIVLFREGDDNSTVAFLT